MTEQTNTTGGSVQRWALTLSYDGSRFYGWQKQAGDLPTVQTALEQALTSIAGERINTIVAGRTDTGVHATAQVVHFDTSVSRPEQAWVRGVNAHLPDGVAVLFAQKLHRISMPDLMLMVGITVICWNHLRFALRCWSAGWGGHI